MRVAIVGGGCAGVTTAFELTRPEHQGRFAVTIYQMGWRLGGKGASGRGPADRIEEHGLHLWMGFYENAFRILRECYAELGRDPETCPIATWRDAFAPDPWVGLTDRKPDGTWKAWWASFPALAGEPGDPMPADDPFTVGGYLSRMAALLRTLLEAVRERQAGGVEEPGSSAVPGAATEGARGAGRPGLPSVDEVAETVSRLLRYGQLAGLGAVVEAIRLLEGALVFAPGGPPKRLVLALIDAVGTSLRSLLESLIRSDDELRRLWEIADLVLAVLRGSVRFGLATDPRGFDAINEYDWREWLAENGASPSTLDSAFLRGTYDLLFAYQDGDVSRPSMAAGQALRGGLRMFFTYRGALFWKMAAGMGDVVFAPFYEVLRKRGVRFEFFHRLRDVGLAEARDGRAGARGSVETLDFDRQARVRGASYEPLVSIRGLPCWPSRPDYGQIETRRGKRDGERIAAEGWNLESPWERRIAGTRRLRVGRDFDAVVLAIGIGAVPIACRGILERDARWRAMVEQVKTVPTQAFQLWTRSTPRELGWHGPSINLSGFVEPFDTWADMPQLLERESFRQPVGGIAYFCSVLPDEAVPPRDRLAFLERKRQEVRENAVSFLEREVRHLWPRAVSRAGGFRWDELVDAGASADDRPGPPTAERFGTQFWTANVNPSDRYTLSLPGSLRYRISPLDPTYDNLSVAGDWTDCGHNAGCVEAAVMSGMLAAHSLCGAPRLEAIVGYDHP